MTKYIKDQSLSIGFNPKLGQNFFDLLHQYDQHIHSYFFSLNAQFPGNSSGKNIYSEPEDIVDILKSCNTYDIPANLLFNDIDSDKRKIEFINMVKDIINLKAVTVLSADAAKYIKDNFPDIETHISVRCFDWIIEDQVTLGDHLTIPQAKELIHQKTDEIIEFNKKNNCIDVINVSGAYSFNDFDLFKKIKESGIKVKIIVNESCLANRFLMFREFPNTETCNNGNCGQCYLIEKRLPWINLTRNDIYKESMKYYSDIDIFKLSLRGATLEETKKVLSYYTSDEKTQSVRFNTSRRKMYLMDKSYQLFLEYIDQISKCPRDCFFCQKCKEYYEKIMKENFLL